MKYKFITIDSDRWEDLDRVWKVIECNYREDSSGVDLVLEERDGTRTERTVASHLIKWF